MQLIEIQDILERWVEEDSTFYHQLDAKLQELKLQVEEVKNLQARWMEMV